MIERRVLKEKETREREKWGGQHGRRSSEGKGDGEAGEGAEEELNPAFTFKKSLSSKSNHCFH